MDAGLGDGAVLTPGDDFFARFVVTNTETNARFMTSFSIVVKNEEHCSDLVSEASPLLPDVPAGAPGATTECVIGPMVADGSPIFLEFQDADGFRQVATNPKSGDLETFNRPILPHEWHPGNAHSLTFYFQTDMEGNDGPVADGWTNETDVTFEFSPPLTPMRVNCDDRFATGFSDLPSGAPRDNQDPPEPKVVAYSITNFDEDGNPLNAAGNPQSGALVPTCTNVVTAGVTFKAGPGSDNRIEYSPPP